MGDEKLLNVYKHALTYTHLYTHRNVHSRAHSHTHTRTCTHTHTCIYIYTLMHSHAHSHMHSHTCICTYMHGHTHTLTHLSTPVCTHSHICTHIHTHIWNNKQKSGKSLLTIFLFPKYIIFSRFSALEFSYSFPCLFSSSFLAFGGRIYITSQYSFILFTPIRGHVVEGTGYHFPPLLHDRFSGCAWASLSHGHGRHCQDAVLSLSASWGSSAHRWGEDFI